MIAFALAVLLLLITPGPGVLSTAGVGAAFGSRAGYRYVAGLCLGTNLVALAVVTGLAGVLLSNPGLRTLLLYVSIAYIVWLAARVALSGSRIGFIESRRPPGVRAALALQALNPKAYVVNTTLFGGFGFAGMSLAAETALKFLVINLIWIPIHLLWLFAGIQLKRLDLSARAQRRINVGMAMSLLGVVGLALWRSA